MIVVLFGPGGAGKGTLAARLTERDPGLWLSRSYTTRPRRPGEAADAYFFVDRPTFEAKIATDGFLEWAEFLGHLYGTPLPSETEDRDVLLEIDLQGARQVRERYPEALLVLLLPPSPEAQSERMRARGDDPEAVERRLALGAEEEREGRRIADYVVTNDDVDRATAEVAGILADRRSTGRRSP